MTNLMIYLDGPTDSDPLERQPTVMIITINNITIALIMMIIRSMAHVTPTYWSASQLLAEHERGQPTLINSDQR